MGFSSRAENGGKIDPKINVKGRPQGQGIKTKRSVMDQELLSLARKVKPLLADSISCLRSKINNPQVSDQVQIKVAMYFIDQYVDLISLSAEGEEGANPGEDIQPNTPILSLRMINGDKQD